MNNQINLIPKTDETVTSSLARYATLRYVAIICMSIVVFCAIALFLLVNFSSEPGLLQEENRLLLSMSQYDTTVAKLFLYTNRLKQVQTLVSARLPYDTNITTISSAIPSGVSIENYKIDEKKVNITLSSTSLSSLNTVITNMQALASQNKVRQVVMNALTENSTDNTYTLTLNFLLI